MTAHSKPRAARTVYPTHAVTYEVCEAVLDASDALSEKLHGVLDVGHELFELLRLEREDDRRVGRLARVKGLKHRYLTKNDQYHSIAALVALHARFRAVHSQVLQDVADRVHRGTQAWMSGTRGPLRAQPRKHYRSFKFTQYGFAVKIRNGRLHMSRLGDARLVGMRKLPGRVKTVTLVFKEGRWFAQFTCEVQTQHSARERRHASAAVQALPDTGLDTGLARLATLADGTTFVPAKPLKDALPRLQRAQRDMSRKFRTRKRQFESYLADFKARGLCGPLPLKDPTPLSHRLTRQIRRVAVCHTKVGRVRRDQHRKVARQIEKSYRCVAVEEHGVEFMKRNRRTSRSVSDVAPGAFKQVLGHVLGPRYVPVGTSRPGLGGNSQTCVCGAPVPKTLADRWHRCPGCGLSADRDVVSANIAMLIAFDKTQIGAARSPEPGQGFVRRGGSKCRSSNGAALSKGESPPATELRQPREPSALPRQKRQAPSLCDRRWSTSTPGAQATGEVNNLQLLGSAQAPPLSG